MFTFSRRNPRRSAIVAKEDQEANIDDPEEMEDEELVADEAHDDEEENEEGVEEGKSNDDADFDLVILYFFSILKLFGSFG